MTLPNNAAIQALAASHFTSLEAFIGYLDELLERLTWAYTGKPQRESYRVYDYHLIKKLKKAIAQDLQGVDLQFNPPPFLPPYEHERAIRPCLQRPAIESVAKATRLAKARGLSNFEVKRWGNGELYLEVYMTLKEFNKCPVALWGLYREEEQVLYAYHLHLM